MICSGYFGAGHCTTWVWHIHNISVCYHPPPSTPPLFSYTNSYNWWRTNMQHTLYTCIIYILYIDIITVICCLPIYSLLIWCAMPSHLLTIYLMCYWFYFIFKILVLGCEWVRQYCWPWLRLLEFVLWVVNESQFAEISFFISFSLSIHHTCHASKSYLWYFFFAVFVMACLSICFFSSSFFC